MMKLRLTKSNPAKSGPCVDNLTQLPSFSMLILMLNSDSSLFDRSPNFPILKDLEASNTTIGEKLTCFLLLLWFFYMLVSFFTSRYIFDVAIGGIRLNTLFLANISQFRSSILRHHHVFSMRQMQVFCPRSRASLINF